MNIKHFGRKISLYVIDIVFFVSGFLTLANSRTVVDQILALICFLISVIAIVGENIISVLDDMADVISKKNEIEQIEMNSKKNVEEQIDELLKKRNIK